MIQEKTNSRESATGAHAPHLFAALAERVRRDPEAPIVGGQGGLRWRTVTSGELLDRVEALAEHLASLPQHGVRPGDRVVLWVPNRWWTPVYFFALWRLGAVAVPFDREMNASAAARILELVEPRLIITGFDEEPAWLGGDRALPRMDWTEPPTGSARQLPPTDLAPADGLAAIYYTSGTTGTPKGCMIGHDNLLYQVRALPALLPVRPDYRLASVLPLSHLFELTVGMLYPLLGGASVHYVPSRRGDDVVRVLKEQRITHIVAVPQLLAAMRTAAEQRLRQALPGNLYAALLGLAARSPMGVRRLLFRSVHARLGGHLAVMVSGGAPLAPDLQRFWELLGIRVLQGYGASECSPVISGGKVDGSTPYGTVGRPIPETEVKLAPTGELLVRGPGVMRGYWRDPDRTAEVLSPDGWYATGDLCSIDAQGNIKVEGRAKELLVLPSGMNVWPQDVEGVLTQLPSVRDAAVVLAQQPGGGATLHAYLLPAGAPDEALLGQIVAFANARLAQHQRLASASWWPAPDFPRTHTLKIKRGELPLPEKETLAAHRVDVTASADDPVARAVEAVTKRPHVRDADTLAALGLDSLGLTELALEIEQRTGIELGDGALRTDMSVAHLRDVVSRVGTGRAPADTTAIVDEDGRPLARRAKVEASAWMPPLWLYGRGRFLRRLSWPIALLHRRFVPKVVLLGVEHLASLPDAVIFAATHRSFADVPTFQRALRESPVPRRWNRVVVAAAAGILADAGTPGQIVTAAFGLFPLRQYGGREESLRQLARVLDTGNSLLLFPQGRHTLPSEEMALAPQARFRSGIAHLARELALPVVPVGLAGDEMVIPGRVPEGFRGPVIAGIPVTVRRHAVAVAFGAALHIGKDETAEAFTLRLETAAFALARQAEAAISRASG